MRKHVAIFVLVLILSVSLYGCEQNSTDTSGITQNQDQPANTTQSKDNQDETSNQKQNTNPLLEDKTKSSLTPEQEQLLGYAFHTFILWVPGVSYTVDDYNANTRTLYTSPGSVPKSTITLKRNGTYVWNSKWDEKVITGNWTGNPDGVINILNGQEGKDWTLQKNDQAETSGIYLGDGSIYYEGEEVTVKQK